MIEQIALNKISNNGIRLFASWKNPSAICLKNNLKDCQLTITIDNITESISESDIYDVSVVTDSRLPFYAFFESHNMKNLFELYSCLSEIIAKHHKCQQGNMLEIESQLLDLSKVVNGDTVTMEDGTKRLVKDRAFDLALIEDCKRAYYYNGSCSDSREQSIVGLYEPRKELFVAKEKLKD